MSITPDYMPTDPSVLATFITKPVLAGIADYLSHGKNQSLFLMAILRGDEPSAYRYADINSIHYIAHIFAYCELVLPPTIWRRPALVSAWITANGQTEIP